MRFVQDPFAGFVDDPVRESCEVAELLERSTSSWYEGRLDLGLRYAAAATAVECREPHEFCQQAQFWYVKLLIKARELEASSLVLDAIEVPGGGAQPQRMVAMSHAVRGELLFAMGATDDAVAEVSAGLRIAERCGVRSLRPPGYVVMALGALRRADMRVCLHFVDKLADEALLGYGHAAGAWVTAHAMEARSGVASAAGLIAGIVTNPVVLRQLLVSEPAAASWLVRAAGKLGADDLARTTVTAAADASAHHPRFNVIRGSALHAAGLLEGDPDKLLQAADLYPDRWCGASAREDMATSLAERCSERDRAIRAFESILSTYNAIGATRDASRVVNKLRDFGVRRGATRTVEREGPMHHGLTDAEFAVADLVSQGHTNNEVGRQLFISQHTVAFHLKKVFQKMNVASRVELAASWKVMQ
ncbi:LuxR C-terminal-related transcriptional regulator [Actinokineospora sp. PR83]|uniref:helix-turn-helix transcriptional regulator n=1 Tax=Actinokineospora sp. PR83 TaxID=2884908 RepID=UPI001F1BF9D7|nr:LuxR C-terminal-related transcriptional regulator [Actinokineospora sp. PR83]MCG8915915.1 LuxR C-terminal-related transcriptional regulator [Actinokineospora sp. PR83]